MAVTYKKLFKRLIDLELRKLEFANKAKISVATLAKLSGDKYVSLDMIEKVCRCLDCTPNDILEFIPDTDVSRQPKRRKTNRKRQPPVE